VAEKKSKVLEQRERKKRSVLRQNRRWTGRAHGLGWGFQPTGATAGALGRAKPARSYPRRPASSERRWANGVGVQIVGTPARQKKAGRGFVVHSFAYPRVLYALFVHKTLLYLPGWCGVDQVHEQTRLVQLAPDLKARQQCATCLEHNS